MILSTVILASAGTGKTHALTSRYIALLAAGATPEKVLATTFTRKAAAEILTRIVSRLEMASRDEGAARELGVSCAAAGELLRNFVRQAHKAAIGTLDSFFSRAAGAVSTEIGLAPPWEIVGEDEDARLRAEAVERTVEEADEDEFYALLSLLHNGGFPSRVLGAILRTVSGAYEMFGSSPREAWTAMDVPGHLSGAMLTAREIEGQVSALLGAELPKNKDGSTSKLWENARKGTAEAVRNAAWKGFLTTGLGAAFEKGIYQRVALPEPIAAALSPLVAHAKAVLIGRACETVAATRKMLERFDGAYRALKRERGAYRFDDIPRLLLESTYADDPARLYERLDARTDHVLLDEFQDTSSQQFQLLRPMLDELVSGQGASEGAAGRSIFCVGDEKQCLYQWRAAEPDLLATLPKIWEHLAVERLDLSYRSSAVVLDAVNQVFGGIGTNGAMHEKTEAADIRAGLEWEKRFRQHKAKRDLPGHVRVRWCETDEKGKTDDEATLRAAAESIATLHKKEPRSSVGVLTPRRADAARMMFELKRLGVDASEEGGNPVTDSSAASVALSMLHLADHPGDTAARFHVATSPLGEAVGLTDFKDAAMCERSCSATRERIARDGYGAILSAWLDAIATACDEREFDRFRQLVELGREFDSRPRRPEPTRVRRFVDFVKARKVEDPRSANVRVMTIHAAKGLEFDAVFLPSLHRALPGRRPGMISSKPAVLEPPNMVFAYPSEIMRSLDPRLEELYKEWRFRELTEDLCVLYVAMTRARHSLEMFVPREGGLSHGAIVREALKPGEGGLVMGEEGWFEKVKWRESAKVEAEVMRIRLKP